MLVLEVLVGEVEMDLILEELVEVLDLLESDWLELVEMEFHSRAVVVVERVGQEFLLK